MSLRNPLAGTPLDGAGRVGSAPGPNQESSDGHPGLAATMVDDDGDLVVRRRPRQADDSTGPTPHTQPSMPWGADKLKGVTWGYNLEK